MSLEKILKSPRLMMRLSLPQVVLQLLEETSKPEPEFDKISTIISADPAIAAVVLQLANSSFYGFKTKITDLKRAAVVLGTSELVNIAIAINLQKHISNDSFDHEEWFVTLWGAIAAKLIAEELCPEKADEVYLVSLLKDISMLLIKGLSPELLPDSVKDSPCSICPSIGQLEDEANKWGINHAELSAFFMEKWNLSAISSDLILNHHDIENYEKYSLPQQVVIFATKWAELEILPNQEPFKVFQFDTLLRDVLHKSDKELEILRDECRNKFKSLITHLGIYKDDPTGIYNHSILTLQNCYFLSLELLTAEGGLDSIATVIRRHLRINWDLREWQMVLKHPLTGKFICYTSNSANVRKNGVSDSIDDFDWTANTIYKDISVRDNFLGRFQCVCAQLTDDEKNKLSLYFKFIGEAYEHYCAKHYLLEDRAFTLETLPFGIARLDAKQVMLDCNDEMQKICMIRACNESHFDSIFDKNLGIELGHRWQEFVVDTTKQSFSKIYCINNGLHPSFQGCLYLSAYRSDKDFSDSITVVVEDIREMSSNQIEALKQLDFLESLVDSMRDIVLTVDRQGEISYVSSRFVKFLRGKNLFDVAVPAESYVGVWNSDVFVNKKNIIEVVLKRKDGKGRPFELVISPLEGKNEKYLIVARDLTEIRRLEEKLKLKAVFDGLTGLYNHSQFNTLLGREIEASRVSGSSLGLLFFDLDGFKLVNDSQGHQAGDTVLKKVAEILKAEVRTGVDFPCRYGGDEFTVVFKGVNEQSLEKVANRIRQKVEDTFSGKVTISAGITLMQNKDTLSRMLKRADEATYEAKDSGGNMLAWA